MKVADLKYIQRLGSETPLPALSARPTESDTLLAVVQEELNILIGDSPEEAPAFRHFKSEKGRA